MLRIKIKYAEGVKPVVQAHPGEWFDLRAAETLSYKAGDYLRIPLGVAMELPQGFQALVAPRSSTFEKYGVILVNSVGVIDNKYCGDNDWWCFPAFALRDGRIEKNDRICQFGLFQEQPEVSFMPVAQLWNSDRGGLGSSGKE